MSEDLRAEIERLCMASYERGAADAVRSLVEAFDSVGMHEAARLAEASIPSVKASR